MKKILGSKMEGISFWTGRQSCCSIVVVWGTDQERAPQTLILVISESGFQIAFLGCNVLL